LRSRYTGDIPSFCTIRESNLAAIPAGTKIYYYWPVTGGPLFTSSTAVIAVGNGDSAVGYCVVHDTASPPLAPLQWTGHREGDGRPHIRHLRVAHGSYRDLSRFGEVEMLVDPIRRLVVAAMLAGLSGCQAVSFADGYKANNCGMTGASCSHQGRSGTVAMNAR
jgi:hypothetical protein